MNFLQCLRVYDVSSPKLRIGNANDGGYILNDAIINHITKLVSIGIGGEDTFEIDWLNRYPDKIVEMYDGTYPCIRTCEQFPDRINQTLFYYQKNVGNNPDQIKLFNIINKQDKILLKIDTEGGEYSMFDHLYLENNIVGLTLEIHDLHFPEHRDKLCNLFQNNFKDMILFHAHGNSWGGFFDLNLSNKNVPIIIKDFPHVMELSFIHKDYVTNSTIDSSHFPIPNLDSSNKPDIPDIDLHWINIL